MPPFPRSGNIWRQLEPLVAKAAKPGDPVDWTKVLQMYGMPKDVVGRVNRIFQTTGDLDRATLLSQAFIRGTPWYKKTFPGIQAGINAGLFGDERGYRAYQNDVDRLYRQYFKRPATPAEVGRYATQGFDPGRVQQDFQSRAIEGTLSDPLRRLFTPQEIRAFANQQAGIDSEVGMRVSQEADMALRVNQLYQDFLGRDVSRAEVRRFTQQGFTPEQVARQFATDANVAAMNPAISHLFTPDEIREIALERAGGTTAHGQILEAQARLATALNPLYHQYTGQGVSREDVVNTYRSGESLEKIQARFAGQAFIEPRRAEIQQALSTQGGGLASDDELQALGEQVSGFDTPLGQRVQAALEKAQRRISRVSQGVLANPSLAFIGAGRPAASRRRPDTAA